MTDSSPRSSLFWRFLKEFAFPHKGVIFLLVANALVRAGLSLWPPLASRQLVDRVLLNPHPSFSLAAWLLGSVLAVLVLSQAFTFLFQRLLLRLMVFISQHIRTRIAGQLLRLSRQFYDASHMGKLMVTALGDPSNIIQQINQGSIQAVANLLVLLGGYAILFVMDRTLTLAISAVFPLMVISFFLMRPRMIRASEAVRESWGIMSGMIAEKIAAVRVVRSFTAEEMETERFRERVRVHADYNVHVQVTNAWYGFLNGLSIHLGYIVIFVVGGWLYMHGRITPGTLLAFYLYFNTLFPMVQSICNVPQTVYSARGSLTKVFRVLDEPVLIKDRAHALPLKEPVRDIRFEQVSFRYADNLPWVIERLNLDLQAGRQVGVLGPSGSGKSTLMALLLRFYDPVAGRILINGQDARDWSLNSLRRVFGLVPQELILFSGSVRENILYTGESVDDAGIWEALEEAEAADFVRALPGGLDAGLGEKGVSLSGGQKQRLSIARALLSRPQVLILDNYSSALDGQTEQRLQATLRRVLARRTAIIVSHRVSSLAHCQHVLVLDAGRLVEQGSPAELLGQQGYFANIAGQQAFSLEN